MSESSEWESEVKSTIAKIVKNAVLQERRQNIRILESASARCNRDNALIEDAITSISQPKIEFHGERI